MDTFKAQPPGNVRLIYGGAIILTDNFSIKQEVIDYYEFLDGNFKVFGLDLFCNPFILKEGLCYLLNIETGEAEKVSENISGFLPAIEADREYYAAEALFKGWVAINGDIKDGYRLMPVTPFFLGGKYCVDNLKAAPSDQIIGLFSNIHMQTRDLPEGTMVDLMVV